MTEERLFHPLEDRTAKSRSRVSGDKVVRIRTEHSNWSFFKTLLTSCLVLLQLGIILSLNFLFAWGLKWYLVFLAVISLVTAVSVLSSHRAAQAKAVWVLFILVFFVFGFVVYFMSNDRFMYRRARKRHKKIFAKTESYVKPYVEPVNASDDVRLTCRYLYNSGGFIPCKNTAVKYFPSGSSLFDDALERIEKAEDFVFIEYFAIADGVLLNRFWNVLERKLKEGVKVRIIYDDVGSRVISIKTRRKIREAGAEIRVFNRLLSRFTFALNYRDHRKIIVVDGKTAYTGGMNLADEYVNEKRMYGYWKDAGMRMDGESVDAMTMIFLRQWEYITGDEEDYSQYLYKYIPYDNLSTVVPYADGPEYELSIGKSVYENVISSAKRRLYIMTPYFIPDDSIAQALTNKALEGVDVRLILPSVPDKYYVYLLTRDNAERLLKYGVKVYYLKDAFVHSKLILSDDCAVVGSINFDLRSFYQQFENAVLCNDENFLEEVAADFEQTFKDSDNVVKPRKNGVLKSIAISLLRLVSPLM